MSESEVQSVSAARKRVAICETQPLTAEGVRAVLCATPDLELAAAFGSLAEATEALRRETPDLLLLDKAIGVQPLLDWLRAFQLRGGRTHPIIWGATVTESEALKFLQVGARGILRKTADPGVVLACLRAVSAGSNWMEDCIFHERTRPDSHSRSELTPRERQVLELVEQGLKNKDIARELAIRPGTVKIHLKHIFEKTGVRGRYGLAITGLREKGLLSLASQRY